MEHYIQQLANSELGHITFLTDPGSGDLGEAVCQSCTRPSICFDLAVADGSCKCPANKDDICKHVEAAQMHPGRSLSALMLQAARDEYRKLISEEKPVIMEIDEELGIYAAVPLAYVAAPETTPDDRLVHINSLSMNCSCHVFKSHSVCPHLLAVVDEDEVDTLLAVLEGPNVLLPLRRQRRIGTSPELEPTQDSVDEVTKLRDIREQAFTAADFEDQDAAAIAAMCRDAPCTEISCEIKVAGCF